MEGKNYGITKAPAKAKLANYVLKYDIVPNRDLVIANISGLEVLHSGPHFFVASIALPPLSSSTRINMHFSRFDTPAFSVDLDFNLFSYADSDGLSHFGIDYVIRGCAVKFYFT